MGTEKKLDLPQVVPAFVRVSTGGSRAAAEQKQIVRKLSKKTSSGNSCWEKVSLTTAAGAC